MAQRKNDPSRVKWVLDAYLLERALPTGRKRLDQALADIGCEIFVTGLKRGSATRDDLPGWNGECVVAYGSVAFVRQVTRSKAGAWQPGSFMKTEALSYTGFSPFLGDVMLNDGFVILPYGEFKRRGLSAWGGKAFIRPDAVTKSFTGFVVSEHDFDLETNSLERLSCLSPEDHIVVAPPKQILGEFRFVIVDRKVVAGSCYGWDDVHDVRSDYDPSCHALAVEIAQRDWQADRAYTCDIALEGLPDGRTRPRLLELNAVSCSGLYACDTDAIATAVSLAALAEWRCDD